MSKSMLARLSVQTEGRTREELVGTILRLSRVAEEQRQELAALKAAVRGYLAQIATDDGASYSQHVQLIKRLSE